MRRTLKWMSWGLLLVSVLGLVGSLALWMSLPSPDQIKGCLTTTMFEVRLCPTDKNYVKLSKISNHLRRAVVAAEDSNFYHHDGFDWQAIQSSFEKNLAEGRYVRGGSTITQQLAKNMFLSRRKTIWRKVREALITREIEKTLKKDEILERYFNVVQFGKNLFGVRAASQFYFKKAPSQLSLNESVFLVFLLPSPEKYSYSFFRKELTGFARKRMKTLLTTLYKGGNIPDEAYQGAISQLAYFPGPVPEMPSTLESAAEPSFELAVANSEKSSVGENDQVSGSESEVDTLTATKKALDHSRYQGDVESAASIPTLNDLENEENVDPD